MFSLYNRVSLRSINIPMLLKVTGWLLMCEALFLTVPTLVSVYYGESDAWALGGTAACTCIIGLLMQCIRPSYSFMGRREGFLLTATVWVWFSAFGMLPFIFGAPRYSVSDAFFEAMSGFTTTGATVLIDHEQLSLGINIWRAMMQWIGGMGIILFTLAVIPMLNSAGGMQMFNAEVTGITHDKVRPRISSTAKALWGTYITLTIMLILLLWVGPMDLYESVCYAFSAISTGGFSTTGRSLLDINSDYIYVVMMIFMFLGGVNFSLIFSAATGSPKVLWKNEIFKYYVIIVFAAYIMLTLGVLVSDTPGEFTWQSLTIYPMFQVITTITSSGFDSGHFVWWSSFTIAITMLMMFMGSCAGSTSGGSKIDRVVFLMKHLANEIQKCIRPNAVLSVRINGKIQSPNLVDKVIAFMCIYVLLIVFGACVLCLLQIPLMDAFFDVFSCVSNTGLSAEISGYGTSFEIIPDAGKWVLSALMLIGRLELFTVLILFTRPFWKK